MPKTEEIWEDPFATVGTAGQVAGTALTVADIALGGPLVRGFMGAPASMPEAETQTEIESTSIREGLARTSEQIWGETELAPPEALTQTEVGPAPNVAREILPTLAELALFPVAAKVTTGAMKLGGKGIAALARKTEEIWPEVAKPVKNIFASETGAATIQEPKYAGSLNLHRLDLPEGQKQYITKVYEENQILIDEARRGVIPLKDIEAKAKQMLADDLGVPRLKWQKGQALNAEQITEVRFALANANTKVSQLSQAIAGGNDSTEMLAKFGEAVRENLEAQVRASAVATEWGRAGAALRIPAGPVDLQQAYMQKMVEALGGRDVTIDIAKKMAVAAQDGPLAVSRFIRDAATPGFGDKIFEVWINALLSGPTTHMVNLTSNSLTFLSKVPEKLIATGIDFTKAGITRTPQTRYFKEIPAELFGAWQGMKEGTRKALFAFRNEVEMGGISKLEEVGALGKGQAIKGTLGRIVRIPSRALMATDEFFKAVNFQSELHGLAYRQAAREGLTGARRVERIAEILQKPSAEMLGKAEGEMLYRVFQKPYGEYGQTLSRVRKIPLVRYVIPFMRTPINIAKFGLERTPLNFIRMAYKAAKGQELQWTDEAARGAMGSLIGATVAMLAAEGKITGGGPPEKGQKEAYQRLGWQPYSVKIGDSFYSYQRLEPLGMVFGMAADYAEIAQRAKAGDVEAKHLASLIGASIAQNLTSKTFLSGLTDAINAIDDPQRYGEQYLKSITGTLVPTGAYQVTKVMDPTIRRSDDILANLMRRTPGLSGKVLPKLDIWGRPITREQAGVAVLSPVSITTFKPDLVDIEVAALGINVTTPGMNLGGVKLTPEQHYDYIRLSGQRAKDRLDTLVKGEGWDYRTDEKKASVIRETISESREWARKQLTKEYPELKGKIREEGQKTIPAIPWLNR